MHSKFPPDVYWDSGRALGYEQPDGEIHIDGSGVWNACAGEDNTNTECSTGAVPNIIESDLIDHLGARKAFLSPF